ncbi:FAD binding domain-containing protein [Trujillonella endophytica]|uniref:Carbon-monoxide dehydrogenase medium subunit n=1 Tax=Trujillonella endophytica TaxID=673521 RepID=A0A1H8V4J5_9ACTN|nr:FAD binding domain-containing protein [Trujillella endophytica]SEP10410.1 carbon-monoxide dehydrogenase medium subunit [Trujillella endophytica]
MKPAAFDYHAPGTVEEAVALLAELGDDAKVLAGGQSLIPMLALRLTAFDHLVDVCRIPELQGVQQRDGGVRIGAAVRHAQVGTSPEVAAAAPLLTLATPLVGHFQIRNRGTLGGAIAHADPAAEYPAAALALDATMDIASPTGRRTLTAQEFFTDLWTTAMEPDEMLVGVTFPAWGGRSGFAVEEFARRHGDYAIAGAEVAVELDETDRVRRCAIGLVALGPTPERPREAEAELVGRPVSEIDPAEVGRLAMAGLTAVTSDGNGSADYRRRVGAAMVARAWTRAVADASTEGAA